MIKANTFSNLKRLDFKNQWVVVVYRIKKILKIKRSKAETDVFVYYCYLVQHNGYLVEETTEYYISGFKDEVSKEIKLRKKPSSDFAVFQQIYGGKEYLPVVREYVTNFKDIGNRTLNIIDGGSNIGLTSLFFKEFFNRAKIICVEPDIENFKVMDFNLKNGNQFEFIKINGAIWSSKTKIKVVKDFRDKLDWSFRVEESLDNDGIQAYSVNDLITSNNLESVDILKIDIEGSEKQVFTSTDSNLDFLNKTKCIALEIHDEFNCRNDIYTILSNYGFTFINVGELTIGINQNLKKMKKK